MFTPVTFRRSSTSRTGFACAKKWTWASMRPRATGESGGSSAMRGRAPRHRINAAARRNVDTLLGITIAGTEVGGRLADGAMIETRTFPWPRLHEFCVRVFRHLGAPEG